MNNYYITDADYLIGEMNGISKERVRQRVVYHNWSVQRAITEPVQPQRRGLTSRWRETFTKHGISQELFLDRCGEGWEPEKAATTPRMVNQYAYEEEV